MQKDPSVFGIFSQIKPGSRINQWEALLRQSLCDLKDLSPYFHVHRALFCKMGKIHLRHTAGHPVSAAPRAQARPTKMHTLSLKGMDEVFSSESLLKRKACCMSFSINGPRSNTPRPHSLSASASPADRELFHMHRSQYVRTYPPWWVIQCLICKRMLWQARGIQLYITKSQTIDRLPARH